MSSSEVIDVDLDEVMPPPFTLRVTPFGESQVGTLQTVVDASYELCKTLGKQHRVKKRDQKRLVVVCATAGEGCPYYVGATPDGVDRVRIHTMRSGHTCGGGGRQRQVKTSVIAPSAPAIGAFVLSKGRRGGNARQLQVQVQNANGVQLKAGQIQNILSCKKGTVATHLGQYKLLPSVFDRLRRIDPAGVYLLQMEAIETSSASTSERKRFVSFFIAPSAMKKNANRFEPVATVDCGHLTGVTQGQLCALIGYDANKHIAVFCFALFRTETARNWERFMTLVFEHFPHFTCFVSDGAKGLSSIEHLFVAARKVHARCCWHIIEKNARYYTNPPTDRPTD